MSADRRKLRGAAALSEIAERLKGFGAQVEKALESGAASNEAFDVDTPFGRMSGRFGMRVGPAERAASSAAPPRRAARPAEKSAEPLVDVHVEGDRVVVTTETCDAAAIVAIEGNSLKIRSANAPDRTISLPCKVEPASLRVTILNGVLEAAMSTGDEA